MSAQDVEAQRAKPINTDIDKQVGFWLKGRPYIWLEGTGPEDSMRLYFAYPFDYVYIHTRQNTQPEQRRILLSDYTYVPDTDERDYAKISFLNLWNPKSVTNVEGDFARTITATSQPSAYNSLGDCAWVKNYFQIYVPQRDNPIVYPNLRVADIPFNLLDIRIEGEISNLPYRLSLSRATAAFQYLKIQPGGAYYNTYLNITAYLIAAGVTPRQLNPTIVPPSWYKGSVSDIGMGAVLRGFKKINPSLDDEGVLQEIIALNEADYIPLIRHILSQNDTLIPVAIEYAVRYNNIPVAQMILQDFQLSPFIRGMVKEKSKRNPVIYNMVIAKYGV